MQRNAIAMMAASASVNFVSVDHPQRQHPLISTAIDWNRQRLVGTEVSFGALSILSFSSCASARP